MIKIFSTRRNIVIAGVATAAVIGSASAAFAYFAASGTGTGTATVGQAGNWTVTAGAATGGPLYPDGTSSESIVFTVLNPNSGNQEYTNVTAAVATDPSNGLAEDVNGNDIAGCYANWFTTSVASDSNINTEINPHTSGSVTVTLTMPANEQSNQTKCAGASPGVTLSVS